MKLRMRPWNMLLSLVLVVSLGLSSAHAQGNGKGKGGGGNDGGGDDGGSGTNPPPAGLTVRYRVEYIPVPHDSGFYAQDVNDLGEVAGWYRVGQRNIGFVYYPKTDTLLTSDEILSLSDQWVDINFVGMNNLSTIVGRAINIAGVQYGIIVYPDFNAPTGWSVEFLPAPPDADLSPGYGFYARKINDSGDVIGVTSAEGWQGSFVVNTGIYNPNDAIPMTSTFIPTAFNPILSNCRKGLLQDSDTGVSYWFDFLAAKTLADSDPNNDTDPISAVDLPNTAWSTQRDSGQLANDGQFVANEEVLISQKKGGTFANVPAVFLDGTALWQGAVGDGIATHVNSIDGANSVGDIVIDYGRQMLHADWGLLNLDSMLVFDSQADADFWSQANAGITDFSDRDPGSGFGILIGNLTGSDYRLPFVLMPVIQ